MLISSSLTFAGNPGNWSGILNLNNNDLDVTGGNIGTISSQLMEGFNNGTWNGPGGITSGTAGSDSTHLTAIGSIQNNQSGTALFTASHQFDGITPGVSDTLLKYTYFGDANLDGKVDGSDYSRIDAAFIANKANPNLYTGWFNGDFNYDGVINGSDYTLIDNAFNRETAVYTTQIASPDATPTALLPGSSAVPEPASASLLAIASLTALGRRRRSR